jgi:exopolyphosphatase/pppGpp-phosphohydrolase
MFEELDFSASGDYATVGDLITLDDLSEQDVTVKRWHKNGKPLKLRLKALDLDQQDQINYGALIKHPKTQQWVASEAAFAELTLREGVIVPRLSPEQAKAMRKRNPAIVKSLVDYIWLLSHLDEKAIEAYASSPDDPPPTDDPAGAADE